MRTVLTAGQAFSEVEGLRAVLAQAGTASEIDLRSVELADRPLREQLAEGACLVLAYVAPAVSVGSALKAAGAGLALDVTELLAGWRAAGELMLALAVRHPEQCLLVNAAAALSEPDRLVAEARETLGLALDPAVLASAPSAAMDLSPLELLLASALVAADREAAALFIELESCAHLAQVAVPDADKVAASAWVEHQAGLARVTDLVGELQRAQDDRARINAEALARVDQLSGQYEVRLQALTRERDRHAELAIKSAEITEARETDLARQSAQAQHLQREGEALLLQLHDAHLESEGYFKQAEECRAEALGARHELALARQETAAAREEAAAARKDAALARDQATAAGNEAAALHGVVAAAQEAASAQKVQLLVHAGALQQAQEALAKLEAEHVDSKARLASLQADTEGHRQIRQERDRARLQVLQLNADTASLQESAQRTARLLAETEAARKLLWGFWHAQQPDEVRVDLRRDIHGTNWYGAEADGRWTGPGRHSTLTLPPLKPGRYKLQMTLVGAMTREIGAGLQVELNGRPLELSFDRTKHPRSGTATFQAPAPADGPWVLGFAVPAVESPGGQGGADQRQLGVRVAEIKFITAAMKG